MGIIQLPQTGIEPVREYKSRRILSPVRLPVPPLRHFVLSVYRKGHTHKVLSLLTYLYNGRWWIRTTEGFASRFTVCPLWPLGKSPVLFLIFTQKNYSIPLQNCKYFCLPFTEEFTD